MKKKTNRSHNRNRKTHSMKQTARRLATYTAAAGLGAFGWGEAAHAVIVYRDVEDITLLRGDPSVVLDLDDNGTLDLHFRNNAGGGQAASIRFIGLPYPTPVPDPSAHYSYALSSNARPGNATYYVRAFYDGEQINEPGVGNTVKVIRDPIPPFEPFGKGYGIMKSDYVNFRYDPGSPDTFKFAGIAINDLNNELHFGWVRIRAFYADTPVYGDLGATLYDWAFETEPNTPILAGAKPVPVEGDYNGDGTVNAADYTVWRDRLGQNTALPNTDPTDTDDMVTQDEYTFWKSRFGSTSGSGAVNGNSPVPEPTSLALLAAGAGAFVSWRRRRTT